MLIPTTSGSWPSNCPPSRGAGSSITAFSKPMGHLGDQASHPSCSTAYRARPPDIKDECNAHGGTCMKEEVRTPQAPSPSGAYSQGLKVDGWVFVSGQGPVDSATGAIVGKTIEEQTQSTLANVRAILEAAGATISDVVKVTAHLKTMADFDRFNSEYAKVFSDPKPVRTTVGSELIDILVEIDVIARLPE